MALQLAGADYSRLEVELLMRLVDTDRDSLVTFTEFTSIIKQDFLKNIEALFKIFDTNGDGFLTQGRLVPSMSRIRSEDLQRQLSYFIKAYKMCILCILCLSLVLYGIRIGASNRSFLCIKAPFPYPAKGTKCMPRAGSLWHKRSGVATLFYHY